MNLFEISKFAEPAIHILFSLKSGACVAAWTPIMDTQLRAHAVL